ncbi:RNase H domain-containing protein [Trichonephila clavipes]|nr:RNase H domain-containing protein [Trichonephila clavipes]
MVVDQIRIEQGVLYLVISIRNPDHGSVFRRELIAISGALNFNKNSICILTDSRSSIQYLKGWSKLMGSTDLDIISKLARLGLRKQVRLQGIPSHVGVPGNDIANENFDLPTPSFSVLSHSEIHSLYRAKMNLT